MCDTKGVIYEGRTEGMNPYKARFASKTDGAHADRSAGRRRRLLRPLQRRRASRRKWCMGMAPEPDHLRAGQSRSRDRLRRGARRAARRDRRHRPLRLSQPGEQRPRLPVHLPRRAGRPRHHHQRRDEARRHPRPGRARQGGRARFRAARLRRRPPGVRPRVHHPQAVRPARADLGGVGGGAGRHGDAAWRRSRWTSSSIARSSERRLGKAQRSHARHDQQGAEGAQAHRLHRRRGGQDPARLPDPARREDRASRSCSGDEAADPRASIAELRLHLERHRDRRSRQIRRAWTSTPRSSTACGSARASRATRPSS